MSAVTDIDKGQFVKTYSNYRQPSINSNDQQDGEVRDRTRFRKVYLFTRNAPAKVRLA